MLSHDSVRTLPLPQNKAHLGGQFVSQKAVDTEKVSDRFLQTSVLYKTKLQVAVKKKAAHRSHSDFRPQTMPNSTPQFGF